MPVGGGPQPPENPVFEAVLKALPDVVVEGILPAGVCDTVPKVNVSENKYFYFEYFFFCILTRTQKNRAGLLFSTTFLFTRHNQQTKTISTQV